MSSKADILAQIRRQKVPPAELPPHAGPWIQFTDPVQQFSDVLTFVGGETKLVADEAELKRTIAGLKCMEGAKQIVCQVDGVRDLQTFDLNACEGPHEVDSVDVAILPGEFAIAENGAIWVDGRTVKQRVVYFLTQHLVLVVPRSAILHNLHEAYERLQFIDTGYGLFISGPSKTADIEQSLVIGAHGPRSMTAILIG